LQSRILFIEGGGV